MASDEDVEFTAGFYEETFARFEELGEDSVSRLLWSGGILAKDREAALIWLERQARDATSARAEIDRKDSAIARSAKDAAWAQTREARRANTKATIALTIAAISAVIAIAAIVMGFSH
jgi:hypothetical protein